MWGQVSMNKALRAFLSGRTVKVVDFNAETVLSLAEVLERFSDGVAFFTETVAVENLEFSEAVEEMTAASPLNDGTIRGTVTIEENGDLHITRAQPTGREDLAEQLPASSSISWAEAAEISEEMASAQTQREKNFQKRKIVDIGKLRSLRAAGWPLKKLAEEFGCSEATVYNTMKREGIE